MDQKVSMGVQQLLTGSVILAGTDLRLVHLQVFTHRIARDVQFPADSTDRQPVALVIQPFNLVNHYPLLQ